MHFNWLAGSAIRVAFGLIFGGAAAFTQTTGAIRLSVQDSSGAAISANVRIENVATGVTRTMSEVSAAPAANLLIDNLSFGRYRLEVNKPGFAEQEALIDIDSATSVERTVKLSVGSSAFQADVVDTTPLPGVNLNRSEIAAPVQSANAQDIVASGALDLTSFLNRRLNGVFLNEVQGNPMQPDLNYRGYTASPLLGTPQGISVYMDGVRLNQPFGDVVSWDLIPRVAIAETTLMPGSNPLFGLNTLGGALSIETKDGRSFPGLGLELGGGSFGRKTAQAEYGGSSQNGWNWFGATNLFFEDGWRANSPSNVRQFFGKVGKQGEKSSISLTLSYANNQMNGNGLQEKSFLDREYRSVYTKPDITKNRAPFVNLRGRRSLSNQVIVSGNAYYRYIDTRGFNGDINEESLDQSLYQPGAAEQAALTRAGYTGFPTSGATAANTPFPFWRCIGNALLLDEPAEKCNGLLNHTGSRQHNYGGQGQLTWYTAPAGHRNQFTVGGGFDGNRSRFSQSSQLGYLNPDRSISPVAAFGDGVNGGDADGVPYDTRVELESRVHTESVFATNTLNAGSTVSLTVSGRYNHTSVDNHDRILPQGGPASLNGNHSFQRFNPSIGITFNPWSKFNAYGSYSEGSRAPTAIELGCANPDQPCKLPNALAGDPPLDQVVTRTVEVGFRSLAEGNAPFSWNASYFHAENTNDILFVAAVQTGFGYFKNFGKTLRQGIELGMNGHLGRFTYGGGYTLLDATFRTPEQVNGSGNSTNEEALEGKPGMESSIDIEPGNRIPLIPRHMFKAFTDVQVTRKFTVNANVLAVSGSFARGNENNEHKPDGTYYLGPGQSPRYSVVNLGARYQIHPKVQFFVQMNNLFDSKYYTGAQLGPMGFTDTGNFIARPLPAISGEFPVRQSTFFAPGAPFGVWGGVRLRF